MNFAVFAIPILCFASACRADGAVLSRAAGLPIAGQPVAVSPAGVSVRDEAGAVTVVSWHRVSRVEGEFAEEASAFVAVSEDSWRALSRLDRGDVFAAEVALERLMPAVSGTPGPTSSAIASGLLRCRLWRGAHVSAIEAWLTWLHVGGMRHSDETSGAGGAAAGGERGSGLELIVPATVRADVSGLVPALPPVFLNLPSSMIFASRTEADTVSGEALSGGGESGKAVSGGAAESGTVELLRAWYARAARGACGKALGERPAVTDDAAVRLVAAMVDAEFGDAAQSRSAREVLRETLSRRREPWLEAWVRVAIGRSLVRQSDPEVRRLGVVELLHVPARLESQVPYLTGVALAESAVALRGVGDRRGATVLRRELRERHAGHPALEWSALRDWPDEVSRTRPGGIEDPIGPESEVGAEEEPPS